MGRPLPKRSTVSSYVRSASSAGLQSPMTMRFLGRCERTRWQIPRACEKANGGKAEIKMTVLGSWASESRISSDTGEGR